MARDDDSAQSGGSGRDRYRDGDDVRQIDDPAARNDVHSDSRNEARGDARESGGASARDDDDRQRGRADLPDQYDEDLKRDNRRGREGEGMSDLARETRSGAAGFADRDRPEGMDDLDDRHGWRSHARQGQAESPAEQTHNEPPPRREGHR